MMSRGRMTRRGFLGGVLAGGAAAAVGCNSVGSGLFVADGRVRRVWLMGDSHIGLKHIDSTSGRDGEHWLNVAVADVRRMENRPDYIIHVGDVSHHAGEADELKAYDWIRRGSDLGPWYEIVGNHDHGAVKPGRWEQIIGRPTRYVIRDGNTVWIMVSAEQGRSDGTWHGNTMQWLRDRVAEHQDHNVIVATHQAVSGTVHRSEEEGRHLTAVDGIEAMLRDYRVDLWLCGHIHGGHSRENIMVRRGRTAFVNVASVSHAYGTGVSHSCLLTAAEGGRSVHIRARDHDRRRYLSDQEITVEMPFACELGREPTLAGV